MRSPRHPARAEVVGSLLRPLALRKALGLLYEAGHSAVLAEERGKDRTEPRELEDAAIRDAVRRQVDLGLDVVTDGEFRRWMFLNSFYDAVEGFRTDNVVNFRNSRGDEELRWHDVRHWDWPSHLVARRVGDVAHLRCQRPKRSQRH